MSQSTNSSAFLQFLFRIQFLRLVFCNKQIRRNSQHKLELNITPKLAKIGIINEWIERKRQKKRIYNVRKIGFLKSQITGSLETWNCRILILKHSWGSCIYSFILRYLPCSFVDALQWLCEIFGAILQQHRGILKLFFRSRITQTIIKGPRYSRILDFCNFRILDTTTKVQSIVKILNDSYSYLFQNSSKNGLQKQKNNLDSKIKELQNSRIIVFYNSRSMGFQNSSIIGIYNHTGSPYLDTLQVLKTRKAYRCIWRTLQDYIFNSSRYLELFGFWFLQLQKGKFL